MSRKIHTSAGNGGVLGTHPTDKFGVAGTDLGFLFQGGKGAWIGGVFGDTFSNPDPHAGGRDWRSPVLGRSSNKDFLTAGITWDNFAGSANSGGMAKQIFPYNHIGSGQARVTGTTSDAVTIIPNDIIQLPDGNYMGMGFRAKDWDKDSGQSMCHTVSNAWFWSNEPNADSWQVGRHANDLGRFYEWVNTGRDAFFQNATFLMIPSDPNNVYVFGSREGRKIGVGAEADGVYLRRAPWKRLMDDSSWEFWGFKDGRWQWGKGIQPTPILKPVTPGGPIGELNAQFIAGKVVLTYADVALGSVALVADRPDGIWSDPVVICSRVQEPMGYAPSVHPWNKSLSDAYFHQSSWLQVTNPLTQKMVSVDYCTKGYRASLIAQPTKQASLLSADAAVLSPDTSAMTTGEREDYIANIKAASREVNGETA